MTTPLSPVPLHPLLQESCARCHRLHVPVRADLSHSVCPACLSESASAAGPAAAGFRPR